MHYGCFGAGYSLSKKQKKKNVRLLFAQLLDLIASFRCDLHLSP